MQNSITEINSLVKSQRTATKYITEGTEDYWGKTLGVVSLIFTFEAIRTIYYEDASLRATLNILPPVRPFRQRSPQDTTNSVQTLGRNLDEPAGV